MNKQRNSVSNTKIESGQTRTKLEIVFNSENGLVAVALIQTVV